MSALFPKQEIKPPKGARLLSPGELTKPGDWHLSGRTRPTWKRVGTPPNPACGWPANYARDIEPTGGATQP